ncbi:MAG: hypothetical protein JF599_01850 [Verrucomicrobia bacterium]|nr:hypothetical protein [Verrucomicrobiota bacterium]
MSHWFKALAFLLVFSLWPAANRAPAATDDVSVSVRFTVISWGAPMPDLLYKSGGSFKKLPVPAFSPSSFQTYTGQPELGFYLKKQVEGKWVEVEVAKAALPPNENNVTILLAPGAAGAYEAFVIPGDPRGFPYGRAKLINITNQPLVIRCNKDAAVSLTAGKAEVVEPATNSTSLFVELAVRKGGKWKRLYDNLFNLNPKEQTLLIFSRGDSKYFLSSAGDVENEVKVVVIRLPEEPPAAQLAKTQ